MAKAGKAYSKQSVKKTGKERKETLVAEIVEKIDASNGLVFTDFKGITHQQLENLRKELKTVDSTLLIAKNSLMRIGLEKSKNFADYKDNEALVGPSATLFVGNDSIEPLKKLQKSIKDTGLPTIKFAVLEGQLLDEAGVLKLASLPGREILLAQFVGLLNAPIQRFVTGLNAIPQKFVMTLDAIAKTRPSEPAKAEAATSTTVPEPVQAPAVEEAPAGESNDSDEKQTETETVATAEVTKEEAPVDETNESNSETKGSKEEKEETDKPAGEVSTKIESDSSVETIETNEENNKGGEN